MTVERLKQLSEFLGAASGLPVLLGVALVALNFILAGAAALGRDSLGSPMWICSAPRRDPGLLGILIGDALG